MPKKPYKDDRPRDERARWQGIDRDAFHSLLWTRANRNGHIVINQTQLGRELGIHRLTVHRLVNEMVEQKRLFAIHRTKGRNVTQTFEVIDPSKWSWFKEDQDALVKEREDRTARRAVRDRPDLPPK